MKKCIVRERERERVSEEAGSRVVRGKETPIEGNKSSDLFFPFSAAKKLLPENPNR